MAFKLGIIGSGGIARRRTIPEIVALLKGDVEVTAVMDINAKAAEETGKQFGAAWFTSEEELLKQDIDAVYIGTPQTMHITSVIAAAKAGKHILLEKPMATTEADALKMLEVCKANNVKLGIAYCMRYNEQNKKAVELVQSGKLGVPVMARAQLTCWFPKMEGNWRQNIAISAGGSLMDMGGHCLDLLQMVFGDVAEVAAFQGNLAHDYAPVEDASTVILRFKNGAHGIVDNYFCVPDKASHNRFEVYGSKGSIMGEGCIGQDQAGRLEVYIQEGDVGYAANQERAEETGVTIYENLPGMGLYAQEVKDFADAVRAGKEPTINGEVGLKNDRVMLAIYEAAKTGKVVKL